MLGHNGHLVSIRVDVPIVWKHPSHSKTGCTTHEHYSANTKYLYTLCTMLEQRRRRWAEVVQLLYKCFAFVGYTFLNLKKPFNIYLYSLSYSLHLLQWQYSCWGLSRNYILINFNLGSRRNTRRSYIRCSQIPIQRNAL